MSNMMKSVQMPNVSSKSACSKNLFIIGMFITNRFCLLHLASTLPNTVIIAFDVVIPCTLHFFSKAFHSSIPMYLSRFFMDGS